MPTTMQGGGFVRQGGFGCTFSPPLAVQGQNKGSNPHPPYTLGKVMRDAHAMEEYNHVKHFKEVDASQRFGIYGEPPELVDPKKAMESSEGELSHCQQKFVAKLLKGEAVARQIRMKEADGDLQTSMEDILEAVAVVPEEEQPWAMALCFLNTLWACENLLLGLREYHKAGMYHGDIKLQNIVFSGAAIYPTRMEFIDFGFSGKASELASNKVTEMKGFSVPTNPYAGITFPVFNHAPTPFGEWHYVDTARISHERLVADIEDGLQKKAAWNKRYPALSKSVDNVAVTPKTVLEDLQAVQKANGLMPFPTKVLVAGSKLRPLVAQVNDVYCVGRVLADVMHELLGITIHQREGDPVTTFSLSRDQHPLPALNVERPFTAGQMVGLASLILAMLRCRVSAATAHARFQAVLLDMFKSVGRKQQMWKEVRNFSQALENPEEYSVEEIARFALQTPVHIVLAVTKRDTSLCLRLRQVLAPAPAPAPANTSTNTNTEEVEVTLQEAVRRNEWAIRYGTVASDKKSIDALLHKASWIYERTPSDDSAELVLSALKELKKVLDKSSGDALSKAIIRLQDAVNTASM